MHKRLTNKDEDMRYFTPHRKYLGGIAAIQGSKPEATLKHHLPTNDGQGYQMHHYVLMRQQPVVFDTYH